MRNHLCQRCSRLAPLSNEPVGALANCDEFSCNHASEHVFSHFTASECALNCGFQLANQGTDTRTLQAYLGHRNIQHTVRYTELSPTQFKNFSAACKQHGEGAREAVGAVNNENAVAIGRKYLNRRPVAAFSERCSEARAGLVHCSQNSVQSDVSNPQTRSELGKTCLAL